MKNKNIYLGLLATGIVIIATGTFFNNYELNFRQPINIKLHAPITIAKRIAKTNIITIAQADTHNNPLTPTQQYICDKFGDQCRVALSVAKAESNDNCNEVNVNTNGTVDLGIFMENSVHLGKQFSLYDLASCQTQIDAAYKLYKEQGWGIWVSYTSGAYKKYLY